VGTDSFNAKDIEYPSAVSSRKSPRRERHGHQELRGAYKVIRSFCASTKAKQFNLPAADRDRILKSNATRLLHL